MLEERVLNLERRMSVLEKSQTEHLAQTVAIKSDTAQLVATFEALKGAWIVLDWVGKLAKPIAFIGVLIGVVAAFLSKYKS